MDVEWDVVVLGGLNTDYLIRGRRLPRPEEPVQGDAFQVSAGGHGANQAVAASRLGALTALVARVGEDERGLAAEARVESEDVGTAYLIWDSESPTGASLIAVDLAGNGQTVTLPGANQQMDLGDIRASAPALKKARVLLATLEVPAEVVGQAIRLARQPGGSRAGQRAKVVLAAVPPLPIPDETYLLLDALTLDVVGARALTGVPVIDADSASSAGARLLERGVGAVMIALPTRETLVLWPRGAKLLPALPVEVVDISGADDAFAAMLAVALAEGSAVEQAAIMAHAAAALATTTIGAQHGLPLREEVMDLLEKGHF